MPADPARPLSRPPSRREEPLTLYLVKRLEMAVRSLLDDALRAHGLTTLQYTALSVLDREDRLSSAQLARRSFVTPQTMNEMVLALERRGLVERERDAGTRRVLLLTLSAAGRGAVAACDGVVGAYEEQLLGDMDGGEREDFRRGLRRACAALVGPAGGHGPHAAG